jgi:hypothetical protein
MLGRGCNGTSLFSQKLPKEIELNTGKNTIENILEIGEKSWIALDHRIEKIHNRTGNGVILLQHTAPLSCPVQGCMIEIPVPMVSTLGRVS